MKANNVAMCPTALNESREAVPSLFMHYLDGFSPFSFGHKNKGVMEHINVDTCCINRLFERQTNAQKEFLKEHIYTSVQTSE